MLTLTCLSPLARRHGSFSRYRTRSSSERCSGSFTSSDARAVSAQHRKTWRAVLKPPCQRQYRLATSVAKPRHDERDNVPDSDEGQWDKASAETEAGVSDAVPGVDWPKLQSLAAVSGGVTLALTLIVAVLLPNNDVPSLVYKNLPDAVQDLLPDNSKFGVQINKSPGLLGFGALVQNAAEQGAKQKDAITDQLNASQTERQKQVEKNRAERQQQNDKVKREVQKKQDQRQKEQQQKAKEKQKEEAEKREKERKEKERKEQEKRKKFREQALVGGSIFGVSALTFGKWQLVASLGAVVFRTVGGPTILSSILRTPGYIIGRSIRVVEWNVSDSPARPDGDVMSFTLRALTPDGLRMAIAKQHGLSNYREVRQVSHWITTTTPCFFEPLRTPAAFKMLPDPAFVVWSRHPPKGRNKLPTHGGEQAMDESPNTFVLQDLPADQATAMMLRVISGVAASSRLHQEARVNSGNSSNHLSSVHKSRVSTNGDSTQAASTDEGGIQHSNGTEADRAAGAKTHDAHQGPSMSQQQSGKARTSDDKSFSTNNGHSDQSGHQGNDRHAQAGDSVTEQHEEARQDPSQEAALQQQKQGSLMQSWSDPSVLQFLYENSAMGFTHLGNRLQLPEGFKCIDKAEEDRLVIAGCQSTDMLSLFRAYAAHDILTFVKFARLCHSKVQK